MKGYPDKYFDLVIDDPPYFKGVGKLGYFGEKNSSINVKRGDYNIPVWDQMIPDETYLNEIVRISKNQIIWGIKVNGNSSFSDCEIASCTLHDSVRLFRYMWNGMNQAAGLNEPTKSQGNKRLNEKRIHPTQKPINLYKWLLNQYAKPGVKILDAHLGSGSSRIAAYDMGFDFTGYEIDVDHYAAQEKRFKQHITQLGINFKK